MDLTVGELRGLFEEGQPFGRDGIDVCDPDIQVNIGLLKDLLRLKQDYIDNVVIIYGSPICILYRYIHARLPEGARVLLPGPPGPPLESHARSR